MQLWSMWARTDHRRIGDAQLLRDSEQYCGLLCDQTEVGLRGGCRSILGSAFWGVCGKFYSWHDLPSDPPS